MWGCCASLPANPPDAEVPLTVLPYVSLSTSEKAAASERRLRVIEQLARESKWDELGASMLKSALKDTILVNAAWLVKLAESGGVLPRCQDVPASAIVSLAEMEAWTYINLGVLCIS